MNNITTNPLVSFCLSTYKRPDFLKDQINCILQQTYTNFEIIISDNDPEESGRLIASSILDIRIKYFSNLGNLGMIKSFNKSVERATGDLIVMITDDDPVYPYMLQTLVDLMDEYPNYGMYMGGCDWFCTHHNVARLYSLRVGTNSCLSNDLDLNHVQVFDPNSFVESLFTFKIFPHYLWSTAIVRKDILISAGGIPDYGTPFLGDYAYIAIMGAHSGCVLINKSLGCQTLHNENFGRNQNEQLITAVKKFPVYLESKIQQLKSWQKLSKFIENFVGVWVVSHLSFLRSYADDKGRSLATAEAEIFAVDFMKKFKIKYYLKRNFPALHDKLVILKAKLNKV